jgi:transcriptional regulator with XRE-family HTH domain
MIESVSEIVAKILRHVKMRNIISIMKNEEPRRTGRRANELGPVGHQVARNLEDLREARRLTQRELAARMTALGRPVTMQMVSKMEQGERRVDADDLTTAAIALGVNVSALLLPRDADNDDIIELTPEVRQRAGVTWKWADGAMPFPEDPLPVGQSEAESPWQKAADFQRYARPLAEATPQSDVEATLRRVRAARDADAYARADSANTAVLNNSPGLAHFPGGVFISYRRSDAGPYARLLQVNLGKRFPDIPVLMDLDSIEPGADFTEVLRDAVNSCRVMVALIGPKWMTEAGEEGRRRIEDPDDYVRFEIRTALEHGVRVIPVLVDGAKSLQRYQLPPDLSKLARLNALELSYDRFEYDETRLTDVIRKTLAVEGGTKVRNWIRGQT